MGTVSEPTVEALYEQVCGLVPAATDDVPATPVPVAPGIRVLALRSPTLPPAAHTNVYLVGPEAGPVAVIEPRCACDYSPAARIGNSGSPWISSRYTLFSVST